MAVIAGPGTGKTKTLVSRIAYLVEERGIKPSQITAVTFTNQAAAEMLRAVGAAAGRKTGGTRHDHWYLSLHLPGIAGTGLSYRQGRTRCSWLLKSYKAGVVPVSPPFLHEISRIKNGGEPVPLCMKKARFQTMKCS